MVVGHEGRRAQDGPIPDPGLAHQSLDLRFAEPVVDDETVRVEGAPVREGFVPARFDDAGVDEVGDGSGGLRGADDVCGVLDFSAERIAGGRVEENAGDVAGREGSADGCFVGKGACV